MAFTGTAVVTQITDRIVRITGLSLAATATGTIGLAGATGSAPDVKLPASFNPQRYPYNGVDLAIADIVSVSVQAAGDTAAAVALSVTKAGADEASFRISVKNPQSSGASAALEMFIRYHD